MLCTLGIRCEWVIFFFWIHWRRGLWNIYVCMEHMYMRDYITVTAEHVYNVSWHTYDCVTLRHTNSPRHSKDVQHVSEYIGVQVWMSRDTQSNKSWHTNKCVMLDPRMSALVCRGAQTLFFRSHTFYFQDTDKCWPGHCDFLFWLFSFLFPSFSCVDWV
jgi:hypothetical protein